MSEQHGEDVNLEDAARELVEERQANEKEVKENMLKQARRLGGELTLRIKELVKQLDLEALQAMLHGTSSAHTIELKKERDEAIRQRDLATEVVRRYHDKYGELPPEESVSAPALVDDNNPDDTRQEEVVNVDASGRGWPWRLPRPFRAMQQKFTQ